jgi:hypothetical protein
MAEQQLVTLPPGIIASLKVISEAGHLSPSERLTGVLMIIWGWAWYQRQVRFDPSDVVLSKEQWEEVCGLMVHGVPNDAITGVNLGLSFMNSGPSAVPAA